MYRMIEIKTDKIEQYRKERLQLLKISLAIVVISVIFWWIFERQIASQVLIFIGLIILIICIIGGNLSHNIYLILNLIALLMSKIISLIMILLIYVIGIGILGSFLKLFCMNRLCRFWNKNRRKTSMFFPAHKTSNESFRRQS